MTERLEFSLPGASVAIIGRRWDGSSRDYNKAPRMYVSAGGAFDVLEDLTNRTRRPHVAWKKIIKPLIEAYIPQLDVSKMVWDQYAGCTCPCSPGFILKNTGRISDDIVHYDVWVKLSAAPNVDETKAPRIRAAHTNARLETV